MGKRREGERWTDEYDFDTRDTHTRMFVAASNWMDRALIAEGELKMRDTIPYPLETASEKQANLAGAAMMMNPTLRENIDAKIQMHKDEIVRLEMIKEKLPTLMDVNLRDLREVMQFCCLL